MSPLRICSMKTFTSLAISDEVMKSNHVLALFLNKLVTVNGTQHLNSYSKEERRKKNANSEPIQKWRVNSLILPVEQGADMTGCVVDINVQSGPTVYLPTGHGVLASTHVMFELRGPNRNLCTAAELAHHLKMMSEAWCCPAVHTPYRHLFSSLFFPFLLFTSPFFFPFLSV